MGRGTSDLRAARSALLLLALGACGREPAPSHPTATAELDADLAGRVRAYSWNDGAQVPTPEGLAPGAVPLGEAGLRPDSRLYVRFGGEMPRDLAAGRALAVQGGAEAVEGRIGAGLRLPAGCELAVDAAGAPRLLEPPFTLELWVRPLAGGGKEAQALATAPGAFSLARLADGRVELRAPGQAAALLVSPSAAPAGAWVHVAFSLDGPEIDHALRLVVDGVPQGMPAPEGFGAAAAAAGELRIGGLACDVDELCVVGRALTTAEVLERCSPPVDAGEQALRLTLDDQTERELHPFSGVLTTPWAEGPASLGLAACDHLEVRPEGLVWIEGQWRLDRPPVRPMARTTHPTVYVGEHRVLIYGGETRDTHVGPWRNTDDTWIYETDRARWRRVPGPAPSPRCHQAAAWSPDHGLVFYPGGWRNDRLGETTFDDTWVFHVDGERWERRTPSGTVPGHISDTVVVYHAGLKRFVVVQGLNVATYDANADRYDYVPMKPPVDTTGAPAAYQPGGSQIAGYDPETGSIVLFGGGRRVGDQWVFERTTVHCDVERRTFTVLDLPESPSPRVRSGFAYDTRRKRFVLYGGVQDQWSRRESDLWTYVPREARWRRAAAAGGPGEIGGFYSMGYDPDLDRFLLLCGRSAVDRFHNDAWRLSLDPEAPGVATLVFDRSAFPPRARFAADISGDGSPGFRFAGSEDCLTWSEWSPEPPAEGARFLKVEVRLAPPGGGRAPGAAGHRVHGRAGGRSAARLRAPALTAPTRGAQRAPASAGAPGTSWP